MPRWRNATGRFTTSSPVRSTVPTPQSPRDAGRGLARAAQPAPRLGPDAAGRRRGDRRRPLPTSVERFLKYFGRWREREALVAKVAGQMSTVEGETSGELTKTEFLMQSRRGGAAVGSGAGGRGRGRLPPAAGEDAPPSSPESGEERGTGGEVGVYERAITLHRLGRSLRAGPPCRRRG